MAVLITLLIPIIGAALLLLLYKLHKNGSYFTAGISIATFISVVWLYSLPVNKLNFALNIGLPFKLNLQLDSLSLLMALMTTVIWSFVSIYSIDFIKENKLFYNTFSLMSLFGMLGILFSENLFTLLLFFEIFSVAGASLIMQSKKQDAIKAGLRYLFISVIGSILIIGGSALLFSQTNSLSLLSSSVKTSSSALIFWMLITGFAIKGGVFPLHVALPNAYVKAPSSAAALLSGVMAKIGAYGIIRIVLNVYGTQIAVKEIMTGVLLVLAILSMLMGSIFAIAQKELKKMLAYSSIAQIGYVVLGVALLSPTGLSGSILHILADSLVKGCLFLAAGIFITQTGIKEIDKLSGIGKKLPITMTSFTLAALSMIGIPPFIGFFSKWFLGVGALEAVKNGHINISSAYIIIATLILSGLLNLAYYGPVILKGWFGGTSDHDEQEEISENLEPSWMMSSPPLIMSIMVIAGGILVSYPMKLIFSVVKIYF